MTAANLTNAAELSRAGAPRRAPRDVLRDVISLLKPRITLMVVITAAGGMWLAPERIPAFRAVVMLLTTSAVVAAANALNCWLERDTDRLMRRTRLRPLPDGRLAPRWALALGLGLGVVSVPLLTLLVNPLTGLLGAIALVSYVAVYTPMKRHSSTALLVGSVPGALPPLMGWTAATGRMDAPGLALFAVLFFWQVPHFLAIASFRREDYAQAGLKTLLEERGIGVARAQAIVYAGLTFVSSLLPFVYRVAGPVYLATAVVLGLAYLGAAVRPTAPEGLEEDARREAENGWARKLFFVSLIYLTVLFAVLMLDAQP
ncbi:MAG: heme o synthase [Myxococcota bacterium]